MNAEPVTASSRRRRIAALLFDHFLFSMLGVLAMFLQLGPRWDMQPQLVSGSMMPTFLAVMALYLCKDVIGGQSIGRAIFAIEVRDAGAPNQVPPAGRLIRRNLFLSLWPVELVALALSPSRQRIGDRLAGTCVARVSTPLRPRVLAGTGFAAALLVAFLVTSTHLVRSSAAYEVATDQLRTDPDVEAEVGAVTGFGALPAGGIQIQNGVGRAELIIGVEGERGAARTTVVLEKPPDGEWTVMEVRIE
jgi:uncharacterized RDD family membrane protein YckC